MKLTKKHYQAIRKSLGFRAYAPIEIIAGIAMAPRLRGTRCGWSSMVYHNSTRRVEVGEDWLNYATGESKKTSEL